ncbi:MAG: hypothetical protein R3Y23_02250 [Bacillota bacterium]
MDFLISIMDKIADFMQNSIDFLGLGELSPALYIIAAGVILVFVAYLIALIAKSKSKAKKAAASFDSVTAYINTVGIIDEENVEGLNAQIRTLPPHTNKGWQNFLDQQTGYPSDYMDGHCCGKKRHKKRCGAGVGFFKAFSKVVILLLIALSAIACKDSLTSAAEDITLVVILVAGTIVVPCLAYMFFLALLKCGNKKQHKRLRASEKAFLECMDNNVIIYHEEQDDFVSANIEEINANIEEILINKLDNTEIFEIVTTPIVEEDFAEYDEEEFAYEPEEVVEIVKPVEKFTPVEEIVTEVEEEIAEVEEEVVATVEEEPLTEEEMLGRNLVQLVTIIDTASRDTSLTEEDIDDLKMLIAHALLDGDYTHPDEQEILGLCFQILDGIEF